MIRNVLPPNAVPGDRITFSIRDAAGRVWGGEPITVTDRMWADGFVDLPVPDGMAAKPKAPGLLPVWKELGLILFLFSVGFFAGFMAAQHWRLPQ